MVGWKWRVLIDDLKSQKLFKDNPDQGDSIDEKSLHNNGEKNQIESVREIERVTEKRVRDGIGLLKTIWRRDNLYRQAQAAG